MDGMAEKMTEHSAYWIEGSVETPAGSIPRVTTVLSLRDRAGWWQVRWAMARDRSTVPPGLYAIGSPTNESHVFVSANYKMSFDHLRRALTDQNCWILVIDTKGINVWCAAGKGTFCTANIQEQLDATKLKDIINHKRLILPQLGAAGVSSQKLAKNTGFRATYGPVYADDISAFLANDLKASEKMRTVRFPFIDRLILTPVELVVSFKYIFLGIAVAILLSGLSTEGYSADRAIVAAPLLILLLCSGWVGGAVLGPILLPYLPGRSFSVKGSVAGLVAFGLLFLSGAMSALPTAVRLSWLLIVVATASFLTMNFTGCSTYTSPSGVRKEMRAAVPLQAASLVIGMVIWITSLFIGAR